MADKGPDVNVQYANLMTNLQKQFLDQMVRGTQGSLQNMPLGIPWGGATSESYNPRFFNLQGGFSGYSPTGGAGARPAAPGPAAPAAPAPASPAPAEGPGTAKGRRAETKEGSALSSLLAGLMLPYGSGYTSPFYSSYLPQTYTNPYTMPFTYGMTGNYPR